MWAREEAPEADRSAEVVSTAPGRGSPVSARAADIVRLQRSVGNRATAMLLARPRPMSARAPFPGVQRQAPGPGGGAQPGGASAISAALQSGHMEDVMALTDLSQATEEQRVGLIRILANQSELPGKGNRLRELWAGFPQDRVRIVANGNLTEWQNSVTVFPALWELVPGIASLGGEFSNAIRQRGIANLDQNDAYVKNRKAQLGIGDQPGQKPLTADQLTELRRGTQQLAYTVWELRQQQKKAQQVVIGQRPKKASQLSVISILMGGENETVYFNPKTPPDPPLRETWDQVYAEWKRAEDKVAEASADSPEIYEAVAEDDDDKLLQLSRVTPEAFGAQAANLLNQLQDRIGTVRADLPGLEPLELRPVREALMTEGRWSAGLEKLAATHTIDKHVEDQETLRTLIGLGVGAAALIATFATGGLALAFAAVAVGVPAVQAAMAASDAAKLDAASKAAPLPGTEIVARIQVDEKEAEAIRALVEAVINALLVGGPAAVKAIDSALMGVLRSKVADEALLNALLGKVGDKRVLIRLLGKAAGPKELDALLTVIKEATEAERLLDLQRETMQRIARLRAANQAVLDANPELEKAVQAAEASVADASKAEEAAKAVDVVVGQLDELRLTQGLHPPVTGVIIDENKFTYLFGNAAPSAHNTPRTAQNAWNFARIGIYDTSEGRDLVRTHLNSVPYDPANILEVGSKDIPADRLPKTSVFDSQWGGPVEIRESYLNGPGGGLKLKTFWEVRAGTRRLTSLEPMGPPQARK